MSTGEELKIQMVRTAAKVSNMFSFPLTLDIYRRLCACEVNTGHNTQITVQVCQSVFCIRIMGHGLCQYVCNSLSNICTILGSVYKDKGTNCGCCPIDKTVHRCDVSKKA